MHTLILALDLCGTFVFALSGAALGARKRVDLFGVLVLALAAATSGGIARDVMLGDTPPAAIDDWRYLATSVLADDGLPRFTWDEMPVSEADYVRVVMGSVLQAQRWRREYDAARAAQSRASPDAA